MKPEKTWNDAMDSLCQIMLNEWSKEEIIEYIRCRDGYTKNDVTSIIPTVTVTDAPMVEYAPVVRCKDCKYASWDRYVDGNVPIWLCSQIDRCVDSDWFCADGEVATVKDEDIKDSGDVK